MKKVSLYSDASVTVCGISEDVKSVLLLKSAILT